MKNYITELAKTLISKTKNNEIQWKREVNNNNSATSIEYIYDLDGSIISVCKKFFRFGIYYKFTVETSYLPISDRKIEKLFKICEKQHKNVLKNNDLELVKKILNKLKKNTSENKEVVSKNNLIVNSTLDIDLRIKKNEQKKRIENKRNRSW